MFLRQDLHHLDFDLLRYCFHVFRKRHSEHSLLELRSDFAALDKRRQGKAPHELTILPLDAMIVVAVDSLFKFAFTPQTEHAVFKGHVHGLPFAFLAVPS